MKILSIQNRGWGNAVWIIGAILALLFAPTHSWAISTTSTMAADLVPTKIQLDASRLSSESRILFDVGIQNRGDADTGVFNVRWFVDGKDVDPPAYGAHEGILAQTTVFNGNSQFAWTAEPGVHTISFVVDVDNHVAESNGSNNVTSITVRVHENLGLSVLIDAQINQSSDDAYHTTQGYPWYSHTDSVVLTGAKGGNGPQFGGWRWTDLGIPADATILHAYVELQQIGHGYTDATTLSFQDSPNPATFSSSASPFHRWSDRIAMELEWNWPKQKPHAWIRTPDLAPGVQELVDKHGSIESLVLLENGTSVPQGHYHNWKAYDNSPQRGAKLHVEYTLF